MKIIEKIEIKYFRSFADKKVEIIDLKDVNIFSGANDSGKSNILRVLNLFFSREKEIDFYQKLDFEKDFSKQRAKELKKQRKAKTFIEIGILFHPQKKEFDSKVLGNNFWISKRFYRDDEKIYFQKIDEKIRREAKAKIKSSITTFLNKIHFQYVPAIKDENFFNYLIDEYQKSLGADLENKSKELEEQIQKESEKLFEEFKNQTNEISEAYFHIPDLEIDFAKTLRIKTENEVDFKSRGDGIQTKFLPPLLNQISKDKKIVIWGFEEPENSLEYGNARKLANNFLNEYSKTKQIFITTHAKEFLGIRDEEKISIHRVFKNESDGSSKIIPHKDFDSDEERKEYAVEQTRINFPNFSKKERESILDQIFKDLGMLDETKLIFELEEQLQVGSTELKSQIKKIVEESKQKDNEIKELISDLSTVTKPVVISEGNNSKFIEKAKEFFDPNGDYEIFEQKEFGDSEIVKLVKWLKKTQNKLPKKLFVLDPDSIKKFQILEEEKTDFLIPFIFVKNEDNKTITKGIENLFDEKCFKQGTSLNKRFFPETTIDRGNENKQTFSSSPQNGKLPNDSKKEFQKFICEERNNKIFSAFPNDFKNFKPLFDKINELFNSEN